MNNIVSESSGVMVNNLLLLRKSPIYNTNENKLASRHYCYVLFDIINFTIFDK